jgi:hypothetical protein
MRLVHFSSTMSSDFHALSTNGCTGPKKRAAGPADTGHADPTTLQCHIARTTLAASLSQMSSSTRSQCAQVRKAVNATLSLPTEALHISVDCRASAGKQCCFVLSSWAQTTSGLCVPSEGKRFASPLLMLLMLKVAVTGLGCNSTDVS